jgi:two-component system OmpR family sensor kinase
MPIRLRVATAFALAMALVLLGTGLFVYGRLGADLARALDRDLRLRAADLSALAEEGGVSLASIPPVRSVEAGESFEQLLGLDGAVVDGSRPLGTHPLLAPREFDAAKHGELFLDRPGVPGLDEPARLLAVPITRGGRLFVLVAGATRENRAEALRSLRAQLLLAGPMALLLATGTGYMLAGTALRAVEQMRRRAAAITGERAGERLPVSPTGDELERLARTLNEMLGRLELARERERSFVADAGHELRTPLATLRAELDFALHHAENEAEIRQAVQEAGEETDRLAQLAGDLLLIAGSDRGTLHLRLELQPAHELLTSVRNRFAWRAAQAGRPIVVDCAEGLLLEGDRLRLEQALGNLVDNALRHGDGAVTLHARMEDGRVELHVRDDGPGFPVDFLARAFERFSRPTDGRSGGGAGLGLAIVAAIAEAHGGCARARNGGERGAEVGIDLPDHHRNTPVWPSE